MRTCRHRRPRAPLPPMSPVPRDPSGGADADHSMPRLSARAAVRGPSSSGTRNRVCRERSEPRRVRGASSPGSAGVTPYRKPSRPPRTKMPGVALQNPSEPTRMAGNPCPPGVPRTGSHWGSSRGSETKSVKSNELDPSGPRRARDPAGNTVDPRRLADRRTEVEVGAETPGDIRSYRGDRWIPPVCFGTPTKRRPPGLIEKAHWE
jgi:hypothetical protein